MPTPLELRTTTQERKDAILLNLLRDSGNTELMTAVSRLSFIGDVKPTDMLSLRSAASISQANWSKAAKFVYVHTTSPGVTVKTDTGYARVVRWDGTQGAVAGTGAADSNITPSFGTAPASPYNTRIPKFFAVLPCNSGGTITGNITTLTCSSHITALDVSGLTSLTSLTCAGLQLTALDLSGLTALTSLDCNNNQLTALDLSGLAALTSLNCSNNQLTVLDVSGLTELTALTCGTNLLTALDVSGLTELTALTCGTNLLTALDVSGLTELTALICAYNQLTALDVSGLTELNFLDCNNNQLTSLIVFNNPLLSYTNAQANMLPSSVVDACFNAFDPTAPPPVGPPKMHMFISQTPPAPPTAASADARAALIAAGFTLVTD
jgi:hypothetical protein